MIFLIILLINHILIIECVFFKPTTPAPSMCKPKIIKIPCPSKTSPSASTEQPDWAPSDSASPSDVWVVEGTAAQGTAAQGTKTNSQVWVVDAQTANSPMGW